MAGCVDVREHETPDIFSMFDRYHHLGIKQNSFNSGQPKEVSIEDEDVSLFCCSVSLILPPF